MSRSSQQVAPSDTLFIEPVSELKEFTFDNGESARTTQAEREKAATSLKKLLDEPVSALARYYFESPNPWESTIRKTWKYALGKAKESGNISAKAVVQMYQHFARKVTMTGDGKYTRAALKSLATGNHLDIAMDFVHSNFEHFDASMHCAERYATYQEPTTFGDLLRGLELLQKQVRLLALDPRAAEMDAEAVVDRVRAFFKDPANGVPGKHIHQSENYFDYPRSVEQAGLKGLPFDWTAIDADPDTAVRIASIAKGLLQYTVHRRDTIHLFHEAYEDPISRGLINIVESARGQERSVVDESRFDGWKIQSS